MANPYLESIHYDTNIWLEDKKLMCPRGEISQQV